MVRLHVHQQLLQTAPTGHSLIMGRFMITDTLSLILSFTQVRLVPRLLLGVHCSFGLMFILQLCSKVFSVELLL